MNYYSLLQFIEDKNINIENNYYYHAFVYDKNNFINMLTHGIKCPMLLGRIGNGHNGSFYVSLTKREECKYSIYKKLEHLPMFIISDKIRTIKTSNFLRPASNPILSFRKSEYDDEYQKFLMVLPKYILGIQFNLLSNINGYDESNYVKNQLFLLREMVEILDSYNLNIPIIDSSSYNEINKKKVLSLKI